MLGLKLNHVSKRGQWWSSDSFNRPVLSARDVFMSRCHHDIIAHEVDAAGPTAIWFCWFILLMYIFVIKMLSIVNSVRSNCYGTKLGRQRCHMGNRFCKWITGFAILLTLSFFVYPLTRSCQDKMGDFLQMTFWNVFYWIKTLFDWNFTEFFCYGNKPFSEPMLT